MTAIEMDKININPEKLVNWAEISRLLCGSKFTLRRNNIPKIHQADVDELLRVIKKWLTSL